MTPYDRMGGEAGIRRFTRRFYANQLDIALGHKLVKCAHSVGAATDACHYRHRQTMFFRLELLADFRADNRLKIANHSGVWIGPNNGANNIVSAPGIRHPIPHGFISCVLQRPRP